MIFSLCPDFWDTQYIVFLNSLKHQNGKNVNKRKGKVYYYLVLVIAFTIAWKEKDFVIGSDIMITKNVILGPIYCITDTTILKWLNHYIFFPHPTHQFFTHVHTRGSVSLFLRPVVNSSCCIHYWYLWHIGRRLWH